MQGKNFNIGELDRPRTNIPAEGYFFTTRRVLYSVLFVLPFAIVYYIGIYSGELGNTINGADAILRFMYYMLAGIVGSVALKVLAGMVLVSLIAYAGYQVFSKRERISVRYFLLMLCESIALGFGIAIFMNLALNFKLPIFFSFEPNQAVVEQIGVLGLSSTWSRIVASVGAGVFEELIFRVLILTGLYMFFSKDKQTTGFDDSAAFIRATLISSAVFACMHIGSAGSLLGLIPIFFGSILLSFLYAKRGFGIAAGSHALFDIILFTGIIA